MNLASSLLIGLALPACFTGTTFTVNSTADLGDVAPGNGTCRTFANTCTLRAAIQEANAFPGSDIILVPSGTYTLTVREPADGSIAGGDLDVTDSLWIRGIGTAPEIDGGNQFRVFDLFADLVRLDNLVIRNGDDFEGGGIRIDAATMAGAFDLDIHTNQALDNGAGILNRGVLLLFESEVHDNHVAARGGGIKVTSSAITTIWNSSIYGNSANHGAGMHNQGLTSVFNSTVSSDSASASGGGIFNSGLLQLANATIAFNRAFGGDTEDAGGVRNYDRGVVTLRNTIIGSNFSLFFTAPDCAGTLDSQGWNLVHELSGCALAGTTTGNITGQDPRLDPLAVYTMGTPTHRLRDRSPAIDAGNPNTPGGAPPACWETDQRGVARVKCDIGAYERN